MRMRVCVCACVDVLDMLTLPLGCGALWQQHYCLATHRVRHFLPACQRWAVWQLFFFFYYTISFVSDVKRKTQIVACPGRN